MTTPFAPVRDCIVCHTSSAHHRTPAATSGDCVSCHGDIVDNIDDGHYIPTYDAVTSDTFDQLWRRPPAEQPRQRRGGLRLLP